MITQASGLLRMDVRVVIPVASAAQRHFRSYLICIELLVGC